MEKRFPTNRSSVSCVRLKPGFLPGSFAVSMLFQTPPFTSGAGGLSAWKSRVKRLKSLEEENTRLKKLLAEAMLDKGALVTGVQVTRILDSIALFHSWLSGDDKNRSGPGIYLPRARSMGL